MSKLPKAEPKISGYRLKVMIEHDQEQSIVPDIKYNDLLTWLARFTEEQLEDARMVVWVTEVTPVAETQISVVHFSTINFIKVYRQMAPYA